MINDFSNPCKLPRDVHIALVDANDEKSGAGAGRRDWTMKFHFNVNRFYTVPFDDFIYVDLSP